MTSAGSDHACRTTSIRGPAHLRAGPVCATNVILQVPDSACPCALQRHRAGFGIKCRKTAIQPNPMANRATLKDLAKAAARDVTTLDLAIHCARAGAPNPCAASHRRPRRSAFTARVCFRGDGTPACPKSALVLCFPNRLRNSTATSPARSTWRALRCALRGRDPFFLVTIVP